ncbi:MAG TPA: choice-of-anchor tandem repeat GloVer-containing protein [Terriglobales bacterium]
MNSPCRIYVQQSCNGSSRVLTAGLRNGSVTWPSAAALFCMIFMLVAAPAWAQTETVLYSFANPPDAYSPKCNLVVGTAGNMYGTTFSGGVNNLGAVFVISPTGTESVLYSFAGGTDGSHPVAGLFRDKTTGNFYGTTVSGGTANSGTVFMVTPAGVETVLYSFKGGVDGANPYSSVVRVGTTIFGTTYNGGQFGYGTVFRLTAAGQETVLHSFNSAFPTLDGSYPYAGLVPYQGVLYGTTTLGGLHNLGTVFAITPGGVETVLHSFEGGTTDGQGPYAGVVFDNTGKLYGTTYLGGIDNAGTVFTIASGTESLLHHFRLRSTDGANPQAPLIFNRGNFYGTTLHGGTANGGVVYRMTPGGTTTVLHSFTSGADGFNPYSALVLGSNNSFYSTTNRGGTSDLGVVFKVGP